MVLLSKKSKDAPLNNFFGGSKFTSVHIKQIVKGTNDAFIWLLDDYINGFNDEITGLKLYKLIVLNMISG